MLIAGTGLLFWNEGNFVKTKQSLKEAESVLVRVSDMSEVDPLLEGRLIHASSLANTDDILTDSLFGICETAISIRRKVEYYQWKESSSETRSTSRNRSETKTTYSYKKSWNLSPVNSQFFHTRGYDNFVLVTVDAQTVYAKDVSFGGYQLPHFIIKSISGSVPATPSLSAETITYWEKKIATDARNPKANASPSQQLVHINGHVVYFGPSPNAPNIGDVRVTLTKTLPADISIIAKVTGNTFEPYQAANDKTVSLVSMGTVSAEKMFSGAHTSNVLWTWLFRLIGILLVIGGLRLMFSILQALFTFIPFLGHILNVGIGLVCLMAGGVWSAFVISISWLWYLPIIGLIMLVVAGTGIWFLKKRNEKSMRL